MCVCQLSCLGWVRIQVLIASLSWIMQQSIMEATYKRCVIARVSHPHLGLLCCMYSDRLGGSGVHLVYLPPYCPELNPIELGFGILKSRLRRTQLLITHYLNPIPHIKKLAMRVLTHRLSCMIYERCGYQTYPLD